MNVSIPQKQRKKALERNTCTNQPLKFNLVTLKFLLLFKASNIAIGSAVEGVSSQSCFQARSALGEGANLSSVTQSPACTILW